MKDKSPLISARKNIIVIYSVIFLLGGFYTVIIKTTGFSFSCFYHDLTGLYCPGCGITRMFLAIMDFNIPLALHQNLAAFIIITFWVLYSILRFIGKPAFLSSQKFTFTSYYICLALIVIWAFLRNVKAFSFFRPI